MSKFFSKAMERVRGNKYERVKKLLLKNGTEEVRWLWLEEEEFTKKKANKFFLACILDYQIPSDKAWENARRLAEDILSDPINLWDVISNYTKEEWMDKFAEFSLHRFPKAHERVWRLACDLVTDYEGDARNIWEGETAPIVIGRLNRLSVGEQIARMIVGALIDHSKIKGKADVKADIHITRVLGRIFQGKRYTPNEAISITRKIMPENPWELDHSLFWLGKTLCGSNPQCYNCYLKKECEYYKLNS